MIAYMSLAIFFLVMAAVDVAFFGKPFYSIFAGLAGMMLLKFLQLVRDGIKDLDDYELREKSESDVPVTQYFLSIDPLTNSECGSSK